MTEKDFIKGEIKKSIDRMEDEELLKIIFSLANMMSRKEASK